ncbi:unnamed protein product [Paramecium primaurelia]|uniref:Uncharacterized protein n=1 Tax=Paramecium primaurelia TaxID=5886 RepID=A0A8S1M771_PARPR|nr:unnamed protein product [Paramecium primaurelia]
MNQIDQNDEEYQKYLQKIGMVPNIQVSKYQRFNNQSNSTVQQMSLQFNKHYEKEPIFQTINSIKILNNYCKSDFRAKKYSAHLQNFKQDDEKFNQMKSQSNLCSKKRNTINNPFTTSTLIEDTTSNSSQYNLKLDLYSPHSTLDFTNNNILQLPKFQLDCVQSFEKNYSSSSVNQEEINSNDNTQNNIELSFKNESKNQKNIDSNKQLTYDIQNKQIENLQSCNLNFIDEQQVYSNKDPKQNLILIQNEAMVKKQHETQLSFLPMNQQEISLNKKKVITKKQKEKQKKSRKINKIKRRQKRKIQSKNHDDMKKIIPNQFFSLDLKLIKQQQFDTDQEIKKNQQIENPVCKMLKKIIFEFSKIPKIQNKKSQNLLYKQIIKKRKNLKRTQKIYKRKY